MAPCDCGDNFFCCMPLTAAAGVAMRLRRSVAFEACVTTMGFGMGLYLADVISDVVNAALLYRDGHYWWSTQTIGLVFLPGLVRGCYELLRSPIVYEAKASDGGGSNFTLRKRKRRNQLLSGDASFIRRALNALPESLSFGLDVLPRVAFKMPGQAGLQSGFTVLLVLIVSLIMMPVYVVIMAIWFPFLPLIQYLKVFSIQLLLLRLGEDSLHFQSTLESVAGETRRAVHFKATETLLEAAPQLFLQFYIAYKRCPEDNIIPSLISMSLSLLSLLKTSHDLQEVERTEKAVSFPGSFILYFITSLCWFAATILFRSLALSLTALYLSINFDYRGLILVPIAVLIVGNILIRYYMSASGAVLHGAMSTVAPAHFICVKMGKNTEELTGKYLLAYMGFNTLIHSCSVASTLAALYVSTDLDREDIRATNWFVTNVELPVLILTGFLSVACGILHWQVSLRHLFRAKSRYPKFAKMEVRLKTFPKKVGAGSSWGAVYTPEMLASSGFFCPTPGKMLPLTCYDCGLILRGGIADYGTHSNSTIGKYGNFIDIIHAAALLRYFVVYRKDSALVGVAGDEVDGKDGKKKNTDNPDLVREAFSRLIAVKPQCNVLKEKEVDFKKFDMRLRSHFHGSAELLDGGPLELSTAGFVGTSPSTVACYSCYCTVDLSDHRARVQSPWAIHAWSKEGFDCAFLKKCLSEYDFRIKTYPREWLGVHNPTTSCSPGDLAKAGFYCGFWIKGKAWVKCHACNAYLYQWPMFRGPVQQQILQQQRQQLKQQQQHKKVLPRKSMLKKGLSDFKQDRRESNVEHQEHPSEEQQQQPLLQKLWLGREASTTTAEIPGVAYLNLGDGGKLELPMVSHYSQNINCWFVQRAMEDKVQREKTFPEGWTAANGLSVSARDVASAGFIHFPAADRANSELKLAPRTVQRLKCTTSRCPKCLLIVDWSSPEYRDVSPHQVQHLPSCPWKGRIKQELIRSILHRMSARRSDEDSDDNEGDAVMKERGDKIQESQV